MTLGEKILMLRKARGMNQEQLAQALAVSRQAVSKWELNEAVPDVSRVIAMSELFGVSTDYLLKSEMPTYPQSVDNKGASDTMVRAALQPEQKWLGATLAAVSALVMFGIWAVVEIKGTNYYSGGYFVGSGLLPYLFSDGLRFLFFCALVVCLIGGLRLLMGKPFWFFWWKLGRLAEQGEEDDSNGIYSSETLKILQEDDNNSDK